MRIKGTDGDELFGALYEFPIFESEDLKDDPTVGATVDEAIEQIVLERCRICPLCGAIVTRERSVLD
jgi:hypothetical protein